MIDRESVEIKISSRVGTKLLSAVKTVYFDVASKVLLFFFSIITTINEKIRTQNSSSVRPSRADTLTLTGSTIPCSSIILTVSCLRSLPSK